MFNCLNENEQKFVIDAMEEKKYSKGETII